MIKKKIISALLAVILVCSVIPVNVFATAETKEIEVANFDELLENIDVEGATIKLTEDITVTEKVTIQKTITIDGNGHNIYGQNNDNTICFEILDGTFTIKNANVSKFGGAVGTQSALGVFKVPETASSNTKVNASNLTVTDYNRSAFDIRSGSFEITDCTINCDNTYSTTDGMSLLTKGILAGIGDNAVTGNVKATIITNSKSLYEEWSTSAIEIYNNANVTVEDCKISNTNKGICLDNYWYDTKGNVEVTIKNTKIDAVNRAVSIYSKENTVGIANANIISGEFKGDIACTNKTDKDSITISGGTFYGEVSKDVKLAENTILEQQSDGSCVARIDNSNLKETVDKYENLVKDQYTQESWENFENNMSIAKDLINNINATKAEIDKAIEDLTNAYKKLERVPEINVGTEVEVTVDNSINDEIKNNDKVQEYIDKGYNVGTVVEIQDKTPTDTEKEAVESAVEGSTIAKYFDISILIKDVDNNKELDKITNLSKNVKFTIALDEELKNVPEGYERVYKIIRIHDGKAEVLETVLSDDKNSIEFSTDRFSTYAISYVDTKIADKTDEEKPVVDENDEVKVEEDKDIVKTGDYIYVAIGVFVVLATINTIYFIRRIKNKK